MSLASLLVRTATVITPRATTDDRGDEVTTWVAATEQTVKCWIGRKSEGESFTPGRDALAEQVAARMPAGTVIDGRCRVRIDGELYEVDGEPNRAWTPRGEHHVRVPLRRVAG